MIRPTSRLNLLGEYDVGIESRITLFPHLNVFCLLVSHVLAPARPTYSKRAERERELEVTLEKANWYPGLVPYCTGGPSRWLVEMQAQLAETSN